MEQPPSVANSGDQARADLADLIDLQMSPLGRHALDALGVARGQSILDIGCGAGQTVIQLADRVGETGRVLGVDVAPRVLEVARSRTTHLRTVTIVQDDAETMKLPDGIFDAAYSRFGVMFFADPVNAFTNIRRMLKHGGRIGFVCWRTFQENELDALPIRFSGLPFNSDAAPFSFDTPDTIHRTLASAGFQNINIKPHDSTVSCGGAELTLKVVTRVGALGMLIRANPALLTQVESRVRSALTAREKEGKVELRAATWIVTASAS